MITDLFEFKDIVRKKVVILKGEKGIDIVLLSVIRLALKFPQ